MTSELDTVLAEAHYGQAPDGRAGSARQAGLVEPVYEMVQLGRVAEIQDLAEEVDRERDRWPHEHSPSRQSMPPDAMRSR